MQSADENPRRLHLYVYAGADGEFTLYEDDNMTTGYMEGQCVRTSYQWQEEEGSLRICSVKGETSLIPGNRDYIITFCGIRNAHVNGSSLSDGRKLEYTVEKKDDITVSLTSVPVSEDILLTSHDRVYKDNEVVNRCYKVLDCAAIEYNLKETVFNMIKQQTDTACLLGGLLALELDRDLCNALAEIITA